MLLILILGSHEASPLFVETIAFELRESRAPTAKTNSPGRAAGKQHLSMKDLGLSSNISQIDHDSKRKADWTSAESYFNDDFNAFDGMSMGQIRFAQTLWHEVDKSIVDSPYLSEYNHTGKIHLSFDLDENGHIDEATLHACGVDSVLKVIALRALRKALKNENKEIHLLHERSSFYAQFSWTDYQACKTSKGLHQNYLSFCHYAENKRKSS